MIEAARTARRFLAVNLIMRYDPLNQAVAHILEAGLLGAPLHAFFENYAGDTPLGAGHWFWKPQISGGIFIEHGVHFFDLFRMWFGPGEVVAAQQSERLPGGIIDQVHCTVRYDSVLLANFYHGFHQSSRMESQEARIVCERGRSGSLNGCHALEIDLLTEYTGLDAVRSLVPHAEVEEVARFDGGEREILARHKSFPADGRFRIRGNAGMSKQELYGHVVRALLADQIRSVDDPQHQRLVSEENSLTSSDSSRADELARKATTTQPNARRPDFPCGNRSWNDRPPSLVIRLEVRNGERRYSREVALTFEPFDITEAVASGARALVLPNRTAISARTRHTWRASDVVGYTEVKLFVKSPTRSTNDSAA
jgi:hypothetical protein